MRIQVCFVATLLLAPAVLADQVTLVASKDNTLYESDIADPYSNGAGDYFFAGRTLRGGIERRGLLAFDVAGAIPAGSLITSASLKLNVSRNNAGPGPANLYRVTASWGEGTSDALDPGGFGAPPSAGDCTWQHRFFPGTLWTNPGGDFVATESGSANVAGLGPVTWTSTPALVADVQGWLANPGANHGWLIRAFSTDTNSARRFDSRENPDPLVRPRLTITFVPPCVADTDDGSGTGEPDGGVDINDLLYYLSQFDGGDPRADVDDGNGNGTADGGVDINDLLYYLLRFDAGC